MSDLTGFRSKVKEYLHMNSPGELTRTTQKELANQIGLSSTDVNRRLNGKGRTKITSLDVKSIVKTLVKMGRIRSKDEARHMLNLMDIPDFDSLEWRNEPLDKLKDAPGDQGVGQKVSLAQVTVDEQGELPESERVVTHPPLTDPSPPQVISSEPSENNPEVEPSREGFQESAQEDGTLSPLIWLRRYPRRVVVGATVAIIAAGGFYAYERTRQQTQVPCPSTPAYYTYCGHSSFTKTVAWSPKKERIASGGGDFVVRVWDALNGHNPATYSAHSKDINSVVWSPNGDFIASASMDKTVRVWNVNTDSLEFTYSGHLKGVHSVAWSPGGTYIVSGASDNTAQVWDAYTGQNVRTYHDHSKEVLSVTWLFDREKIASGSRDTTVRIWNATTGRTLRVYSGHTHDVWAVENSPNGNYIASASADKTVHVWDVFTGNVVFIYRDHSDEVHTVAWSPRGEYVASGGLDHTVQIWDSHTGKNVQTYRGHSGNVNAIVWSPKGEFIASASADGTVQVWQPNLT